MAEGRTIAAVATPNGAGGIGVVRISGVSALEVADRIFAAADGILLAESRGYRAHFGNILRSGERIDDGIALVFRAPHSYTGEDTVEISCHGGVYITRMVLRSALEAGAFPAEPGEFTRRAFLNSRIDLAEAESIMAFIGAQGEQAAAAAYSTLEGQVSGKISAAAQEIIALCAGLAAWVDYPDEDIPGLESGEIHSTLSRVADELRAMIKNFDSGRALTCGVDAVIVGRPNVGKSTLMNLLSGCEKSIVTDIPGTTRDVVEETVQVGGILLRLADTAGLRSAGDEVESIGVELAKKRMSRAELIIAVFDGAQELSEEDEALLENCRGKRALAVINKSDLGGCAHIGRIREFVSAAVELSAKTGEGRAELERELAELLGAADFDPSAASLASERQLDCCRRALENLEQACAALNSGVTLDAVNVCVDCAIDALLELTGERASEAVVDEVFSRFCVGK